MSSYLPEYVYSVCTFHSGYGYRNFVRNTDLREKYTVFYKSKEKPLLVIVDKKLSEDFSCKTKWSSGFGTVAFGAGVITGLAVAATVATIPVVGWIAGGLIALGCLAYGLWQMFSKPTCSEMISFKESGWIQEHPTVTFDKHKALTKKSMLMCKEGGILLPFISEESASSAAWKIGLANQSEIAITTFVSFVAGFGFGYTGGTVGLFEVGVNASIGLASSYAIYQPLEKTERSILRGAMNEDENNLYYDKIVEEKQKQLDYSNTAPPFSGSDKYPDASKFDSLDDFYDPGTIITDLKDVRESAAIAGASAAELAKIDVAITQAQQNRSFSKTNTPAAYEIMKDAQNGKYGEQGKAIFTNKSGDGRGMNTQSNHEKLQGIQNEQTQQANQQAKINSVIQKMNIASLILPFVSAGINEVVLKVATDIASEDNQDSVSIVAATH